MIYEAEIQTQINTYRRTNPSAKKLTDEQILSILVNNGKIKLTADQKRSVFGNSQIENDNTGLQIEKNTPKKKPEETIYLQSGRKVVYSKLDDGKMTLKYFGVDGAPLKPDYFKKVEGQISISADGKSYTVTKNGKKQTLKAKNPAQGALDQNIARLNTQERILKKTKDKQGFIGSSWDWFKNTTGIGDGSDKAQKQIDAEIKLLKQIKTGKFSKKDFKEATGLDYTKENLEKFKRGELSKAAEKVNGYKEGQEMAVDVAGDLISGVAAVCIYTAAIAAAPFTGGASIAVGIALATASGAAIKIGVKSLDAVTGGRKYTLEDLKHDAATGAFSGALAPLTGGLGGAVGKTVATKLGIQAVKQVGKEVAEEVVETGVKQGLKTALTNPAGYEYVGGSLLKRGMAMAAEMATDGALGGAIDGGFRAGLDNNWDAKAMLDGAVEGGIGGAIMSPIIGGGMKASGKGAQKVFGKDNVHVDSNGNKVVNEEVNRVLNSEAKFKEALESNPLGIEYNMGNFTATEINLVNQVYDAIKHSVTPDKHGFPDGALRKLYESGNLTEHGICAICDIGGRNYMSPSDYEFFCKNKVKLTSVDSPYIIEERYYTVTHKPLSQDSPSFKEQAPIILKEQRAKMVQVPKEGKVVIVSGHPASGKSTATESVINKDNYLNVDPDAYKSSFIEFNGGLGTDVVHKASGIIRNTMIDEAIAQKTNLIVETTGNAAKVQKQIDMFRQAGYQVELIHINREPKVCAAGLVKRANKEGRVVPPEILINDAVGSDYTTIPTTIKDNNPDITVTTFTNEGSREDFLNTKKVL